MKQTIILFLGVSLVGALCKLLLWNIFGWYEFMWVGTGMILLLFSAMVITWVFHKLGIDEEQDDSSPNTPTRQVS